MTAPTTTGSGGAPAADPLARPVPPLGGFNLPFVRLEVRRNARDHLCRCA